MKNSLIQYFLQKKWIPYITYCLLAVNILLFISEEIAGGSEDPELAIRFGALVMPYVMNFGQFYRLVTAIFLHFGIEHLASNMLSLFFLGPYVEAIFGRVYFLIFYLFSGIMGNLLTMAVELYTGHYTISAGASGAIFGLLGVMLYLALQPRFRKVFPLQRVFIGVGLSLLGGFTLENVNVYAHIGGLVAGFLLAAVITMIQSHSRKTPPNI